MLQAYAGSEGYGAWDCHHRNKRERHARSNLSQRQEVILSYLIGLGPVGSLVEIDRKTLYADCGFNNQQTYYQAINVLIDVGCIARLSCGSSGSTGWIVVLNRGGL